MISIKNIFSSKDLVVILVLVIFEVLYLSLFYNYGINLLDEGYLLNSTSRILNGEVPYKDFYTPYPPGTYYLTAFIFKIFGVSGISLRVLEAFILLSSSVIIFCCARLLGMQYSFSIISAIFMMIGSGPWHKCFFPFFSLLNILAFLVFIKKRNFLRFSILSVILALTLLFRQDLAVISIVLIFLYFLFDLVREKQWNKIGKYFGSLLGIIILINLFPLLFFLSHNAGPSMRYLLLEAGYNEVQATSLSFGTISIPSLLERSYIKVYIYLLLKLLFYLPLVAYGISLLYSIYQGAGSKEGVSIIYITLFGLFSYHQVLWRSDLPHLLQSSAPAYLLIGYLLDSLSLELAFSGLKRTFKTGGYIFIIAFLILYSSGLLFAGGESYPGNILSRFRDVKKFENDRFPLYFNKELAGAIEECVGTILNKTNNEETILSLPDIPIFYFLTDRKNGTYHDLYLPGRLTGENEQLQIIENFKKYPPKIVIFNENQTDDNKSSRRFENQQYLLNKFIKANY
ncbi:glycosyltransferase family 39 protein, partial [bacterium]|nr:glycosyltransferase family 39 protein [bacterium]